MARRVLRGSAMSSSRLGGLAATLLLLTTCSCASDTPCPALAAATVGPEGGTLTHCSGASLVVPPGAVASPTRVTLERVPLGASPEVPYRVAGPAFRLGPETLAPAQSLMLRLPHDGGARMELAQVIEPTFERFEVCEVDATHVGQGVYTPGVYVALHDPTTYPASTSGLGAGTVTFTLDGAADTLDVDPWGLAIDEAHGTFRQLTLTFRRSTDTALVQLELKLQITETGEATLAQVSYADTAAGTIWSADVLGFPGDLQVVLTADDGATITGEVTATLHLADQTRALQATFTATPTLFRYPPERVCESPEG